MANRPEPDAPDISVIIPCYNLGAYLDEAVDSVLAQTRQNFEIVIVDDGSDDPATRALLAGYERPRTQVLHAEHRGLAAARNLGIASSRGEYLCALDADDRLHPSFLARTAQVLDTDRSVTFVSAWLRTFGSEEWDWQPERCDLPTLLWEDTVLTAALVRRQAVEETGGYDTGMPVQGDEDWDLWIRLVERGHRGVILPETLFYYRRRPGSMSTVCWRGPGHLPLARHRIAEHADSYRRHLFDVLTHQDDETAALLRRNDVVERYVASDLEPAVEARRAELATLQARLTALQQGGVQQTDVQQAGVEQAGGGCGAALSGPRNGGPTSLCQDERRTNSESDRTQIAALREHTANLEAALRASSGEVLALRSSKSWRVTSPLRRAYDWWLRLRGRA